MNKEKIMKMVQYGGAIFSRFCPKCGKETKPERTISINHFMINFLKKRPHTANGKCNDCGSVRLPFLGWESDLI